MNREKHECSLSKVVSDAGSTPAASTTLSYCNYYVWDRSTVDNSTVPPSAALPNCRPRSFREDSPGQPTFIRQE